MAPGNNSSKCCSKKPCSSAHEVLSEGDTEDYKASAGQSCGSSNTSCCEDGDCSQTLPSTAKQFSQDVETGQRQGLTHVDISISGLTCTSCAKKAQLVLSRIPGVTGCHVNFVARKGEFDADPRRDPAKVIAQFEHESGFRCARIMNELQELDVVMTKLERKQLEKLWPDGIHSFSSIDRNICTITFDPKTIGARSVLSYAPSGRLASPRGEGLSARDQKAAYRIALNCILATIFTVPVVVLAWCPNSVPYDVRSVISLCLASCVQIIAIPEFYLGAFKALIYSKSVELDMLVVISITAAYGYSIAAFIQTHRGYALEQPEFFETSTLLITLLLLGRLISMLARMKALKAVSMQSLQPRTALIMKKTAKSTEIDVRLLEYGDYTAVLPHRQIATDGEVVVGTGGVDESMITGECAAVFKKPGSVLIAGTLNGSCPLLMRVTRLSGQNSVSDIAGLVEDALKTTPPMQDLADRVAKWFIPMVLGVSLIVFIVWTVVGLKVRNNNAAGSLGLAISYSITVLAISCPCALGLAVPMVLVVAGGIAAKHGVVIKQASATERAHKTTDVVFDKTGTLTLGELEVVTEQVFCRRDLRPKITELVSQLVATDSHPICSAIVDRMQCENGMPISLEKVQSIPGKGIKATWNGLEVRGGNPDWLGVYKSPEISRLLEEGLTIFAVTIQAELVACYGLRSTLRPEAVGIIDTLRRRHVTCHIVSGDNARSVENVAQLVGIKRRNTASSASPADKSAYVRNLTEQGKTILFCGDGTNDAVAVAQANIGVQIGSMSDLTKATADVVLTGGLEGLLLLLDISRGAYTRIIINFCWSAIYNSIAILLASGAFVKARIPPAYAGLGELVSVLPVIVIALTIGRSKRGIQ